MKTFNTAALGDLGDYYTELVYCGLDGLLTTELRERLPQDMGDTRHVYDHARLRLPAYLGMSWRGFLIDSAEVARKLPELDARAAKLTDYWDALSEAATGAKVNPRSGPQLIKLFYDTLAIPKIYRTKKGKTTVATDRKALERIYRNYLRGAPFAQVLMHLRDLAKIKEVLTKELRDGRWHASFNIGGTNTGRRSSSSDPFGYGANLQNIDKDLRSCFVPDPGYVLFQCDQQGAESRAVAYLSGDPGYIKAVESGDAHSMVAGMVFGLTPTKEHTEVEYYRGKSYRHMAKVLGHGSNYLGQARTMAMHSNIEVKIAENFQDLYFKTFPGLKRWQLAKIAEVQRTGRLTTPFGRRRVFWGRLSDDSVLREAVAYEPQSMVGEITAIAAVRLHAISNVELLADGHDALIFQIKKELVDTVMPLVQAALKITVTVKDIDGVARDLTIPWDISWGYNWGPRVEVKDKSGTVIAIKNRCGLVDYGKKNPEPP